MKAKSDMTGREYDLPKGSHTLIIKDGKGRILEKASVEKKLTKKQQEQHDRAVKLIIKFINWYDKRYGYAQYVRNSFELEAKMFLKEKPLFSDGKEAMPTTAYSAEPEDNKK